MAEKEEQWNVRELKRQMKSMLFHRLALSRSKEEVLELAREGQVVQEPVTFSKTLLYGSLWMCL